MSAKNRFWMASGWLILALGLYPALLLAESAATSPAPKTTAQNKSQAEKISTQGKSKAASAQATPAELAPSKAPAGLAQRASEIAAQAYETLSFEAIAEDYWETQMRLYPLWATFVNHPRYHDKLEDIGPSGRAKEQRELKRILENLSEIDTAQLSEEERISWEVMKFKIEESLEGYTHKFYQWNIDHMDGAQSWIPTVIELAQPMKTAQNAEALLSRMKAMPVYFESQIANLREGIKEGRIAARVAVEKTLRQLEDLLKLPVDQTPFTAAARKLPQELRSKYLPMISLEVEASVYPAYRSYLSFLKGEYLGQARPDDRPGLKYLPGGEAAYRYTIRRHTTLDKEAQELHQIGLKELEGIRGEMEAVAGRMGHTGDVKSFLDKVRKDPANFFKTREEVLAVAQNLVAKAQARLPGFFGTLPKTPLEVKPVESYKEKNSLAAQYFQPPEDLSRPGIYYINTYEPQTRPRFSMTSLAVHEGVPGHHLQLALALERRDLPTFRRHMDFTAFVEGWALYAERLADEMGLYAEDLSRLGMLSDQAWRATRLVVDTGIHAMGWSRKQAVDFMKTQVATSEEEVVTEIDRYIVWPGQALAYKVGQREIISIRRQAQSELGQSFDLRAFHDAVLRNGPLPLPVLRRLVLASQKRPK